jgi:hypothetical protein
MFLKGDAVKISKYVWKFKISELDCVDLHIGFNWEMSDQALLARDSEKHDCTQARKAMG